MTYLGIDVGGTKVACRFENDRGDSYETTFRWPRGTATATEDFRHLAHHLPVAVEPVTAVGVAMPATVDVSGHVVTWPSRPAWTGFDVRSALGKLFPGADIRCADDGDLAAFAEARHANRADLVYLGVGTGVGGGIVLGGRPCPGLGLGSAELGHIVVDRSGPACACGRHGCLQAISSGPATLRRAGYQRGGDVTFGQLREGLAGRRAWALSALEETYAALATAVISVAELVHPSLVLVGGGFAAITPDFAAAIDAHATRLARPGHPAPPVRPAALGTLSSLHGALLAAREHPCQL